MIKMDLTKCVRNGIIALVSLFSLSFFGGFFFNEVFLLGSELTLFNITMGFIGALLVAIFFGFVLVFVLSLIYFFIKSKFKQSP